MNVCIINDLYIDLSCLYDSRRFPLSPKAILHNSFHKCVVITLKKSSVRKGSNITHLKVKYDAWKRNSKS